MPIPIYVIGSSNTDMVVKSVRLPLPGETIIGGDFFMNAGGKGANQAVAAARLGGQVTLAARVGNDLFGKQTIQQLNHEGIDVAFISIDSSYPSGVALINVDDHGENCITVAPGANAQLTPANLENLFSRIASPAIVLTQLEIPLETVEFVAEQCFKKSITLILNPAPAHSLSRESLKKIAIITPNEHEAEMLTGIKLNSDASAQHVASALHGMGVPQVVLTLGSRGAYFSSESGSGFVDAPKVNAVDTTAAGDCFNGALAVALAEQSSLQEACSFACLCASRSVTKMGAQSSMPTRSELQ